MTVVVITGASSGIGRATAVKFAQEGWNVVVTGRNSDELQKTKLLCQQQNIDALPLVADMTIEADVERIMEETIGRFSRLDCLVNNAGMATMGDFETGSLEQFDQVINTNLRSVFQLTKLAVPHLVTSQGNIVNVSTVATLTASGTSLLYGISKAGLDQLTKCLSMELASKQVRVNSVHPGYVPTNIIRRSGAMSDEELDKLTGSVALFHPLNRNGTVEEVANAIYFLASDSSGFTTGCQLPVDGGVFRTSSFYGFKTPSQ